MSDCCLSFSSAARGLANGWVSHPGSKWLCINLTPRTPPEPPRGYLRRTILPNRTLLLNALLLLPRWCSLLLLSLLCCFPPVADAFDDVYMLKPPCTDMPTFPLSRSFQVRLNDSELRCCGWHTDVREGTPGRCNVIKVYNLKASSTVCASDPNMSCRRPFPVIIVMTYRKEYSQGGVGREQGNY